MNVDEYFEVYTGGNDYIKTWTPKALKEFAEDYHKQKLREGENCVLPLVSVSLLDQMKLQADVYTEREAKAFELADHLKAYENKIKATTVNQIILMLESNER